MVAVINGVDVQQTSLQSSPGHISCRRGMHEHSLIHISLLQTTSGDTQRPGSPSRHLASCIHVVGGPEAASYRHLHKYKSEQLPWPSPLPDE